MEKEKHEELLQELLNPEIDQSRRTEVLQELRVDNGKMLGDMETLTESNNKLQKNNDDLVVSNSQLFRQVGVLGQGEEKKKEEEEKEFSETVTLEQFENQ